MDIVLLIETNHQEEDILYKNKPAAPDSEGVIIPEDQPADPRDEEVIVQSDKPISSYKEKAIFQEEEHITPFETTTEELVNDIEAVADLIENHQLAIEL